MVFSARGRPPEPQENRPFNLPILSLSAISPQEGDEVLVRKDRNNYRELILRDGAVAGIILQGKIGGNGFWQHLIKNKIRLTPFERPSLSVLIII
jgi:NAD(P)H-nitrite reductase large subunit